MFYKYIVSIISKVSPTEYDNAEATWGVKNQSNIDTKVKLLESA